MPQLCVNYVNIHFYDEITFITTVFCVYILNVVFVRLTLVGLDLSHS